MHVLSLHGLVEVEVLPLLLVMSVQPVCAAAMELKGPQAAKSTSLVGAIDTGMATVPDAPMTTKNHDWLGVVAKQPIRPPLPAPAPPATAVRLALPQTWLVVDRLPQLVAAVCAKALNPTKSMATDSSKIFFIFVMILLKLNLCIVIFCYIPSAIYNIISRVV